MAPRLEDISIEMLWCVMGMLDKCDQGNFRLTSRTIENNTRRYYATYFKNTSLTLGERDVHRFLSMTWRPSLFVFTKHLTINGITLPGRYEERREVRQARIAVNVHTLANAFANLIILCPGSFKLDCLHLGVVARGKGGIQVQVRYRSWKRVREAAIETYDTVMNAIRSPATVTAGLDVFSEVYGCGLDCSRLSDIHLMSNIVGPLKDLSLSLSSDDNLTSRGLQDYSQLLEDVIRGMVSMPHLENLEVRYFCAERKHDANRPGSFNTPHDIVPMQCKPPQRRLKNCAIRGVYVTIATLLEFIDHVNPTNLVLDNVHIMDGHLADVIQNLERDVSPVVRYQLHDIYEYDEAGRHFLKAYFNIKGKPEVPVWGQDVGPSSVVQNKLHKDFKVPLTYTHTTLPDASKGLGWFVEQENIRYFGPVKSQVQDRKSKDLYDFAKMNSHELPSVQRKVLKDWKQNF
ncbi:hypothetical protein M426DRAFT_22635 [Hypoxylon sp. CI-4A]|nr:hypothetical protein M426DRAFT_22635 [Hypoxylon sp. CI-4A]